MPEGDACTLAGLIYFSPVTEVCDDKLLSGYTEDGFALHFAAQTILVDLDYKRKILPLLQRGPGLP